MSATQLIWAAAGHPATEGKTGSRYQLEQSPGRCATCAVPISDGVPFEPRRGVAGINNGTFHGHAEYARWGTHVCAACAWLFGDPKRTHRSILVLGESIWWPILGQPTEATEGRPRWREVFGCLDYVARDTPMAGILTTDTKPRLWPRIRMSLADAPGLYIHSPAHNWSHWTHFDRGSVAAALQLVDAAMALGATRMAAWQGLAGNTKLLDHHGLDAVLTLDESIQPLRGGAELLIACLIA
jgi:hypothetical protein